MSRDRLLPLSQISARSSLSPTLSLCVSFSLPLLHTRKKPLLQPPCLPYFPPFSTGLHRQETFNSHIPFSNHPGPFFHRQPLWRWSRVLHDWGHAYAGCNCVVVSCPRVDIIVPARIETLSSPPFFRLARFGGIYHITPSCHAWSHALNGVVFLTCHVCCLSRQSLFCLFHHGFQKWTE